MLLTLRAEDKPKGSVTTQRADEKHRHLKGQEGHEERLRRRDRRQKDKKETQKKIKGTWTG